VHDAKQLPLKVGDTVLIPATITRLSDNEDYCNVDLTTTLGRRPDGAAEYVYGINTGVLRRNLPGDDNVDLLAPREG